MASPETSAISSTTVCDRVGHSLCGRGGVMSLLSLQEVKGLQRALDRNTDTGGSRTAPELLLHSMPGTTIIIVVDKITC